MEDRPYMPVSEPKQKHIRFETYYRCPMCGQRIDGVKLTKGRVVIIG